MGNWLIFVPDKFRQHFKEICRTNYYLMMICLESLGDKPRILKFVGFPLCKSDRESLDWLRNHAVHHGSNRGRVDAARQEHSQRNVRHQSQPYRLAKEFAPFRNIVAVAAHFSFMFLKTDVPVLPDLNCSVAPQQSVSRQQPFNVAKECVFA